MCEWGLYKHIRMLSESSSKYSQVKYIKRGNLVCNEYLVRCISFVWVATTQHRHEREDKREVVDVCVYTAHGDPLIYVSILSVFSSLSLSLARSRSRRAHACREKSSLCCCLHFTSHDAISYSTTTLYSGTRSLSLSASLVRSVHEKKELIRY